MEAQIFKDIMICDMDFIKKYMIETILYEQEIQKLLNEKKLQTQEVQTNTIKAVDASSVTQIECCRIRDDINESSMSRNECNYSRNESSILETACNSVKENITDSETKDVHAIKYKMSKSKERCMTYFRSLHSHLHVLSKEDLKGTRIEHGFKWGQDDESFINYDSQMTSKYFVEYTRIEVKDFRDTLFQHIDIRPIYDEDPMANVQLTVECNVSATGQKHIKQPEFNTERGIDQYTKIMSN
ncbi:hypothetical protein Tco_0435897 [Tanacetum coccineum]